MSMDQEQAHGKPQSKGDNGKRTGTDGKVQNWINAPVVDHTGVYSRRECEIREAGRKRQGTFVFEYIQGLFNNFTEA